MPAKNDNPGQDEGSSVESASSLAAPAGAILIADDNKGDALAAKKVAEELQLPAPVRVVFGGEEVLAYLEGQPPFDSRDANPYPDLVLLDLRMPDMDGFEVLKWLRARPQHRNLPVVVTSGARELSMVTRAYQLGARSFLIKPLTLDQLKMTVQALSIFPNVGASRG